MHAIGPHYFPGQESEHDAKYFLTYVTRSPESLLESRNNTLDASVWATQSPKLNAFLATPSRSKTDDTDRLPGVTEVKNAALSCFPRSVNPVEDPKTRRRVRKDRVTP